MLWLLMHLYIDKVESQAVKFKNIFIFFYKSSAVFHSDKLCLKHSRHPYRFRLLRHVFHMCRIFSNLMLSYTIFQVLLCLVIHSQNDSDV